MYDQRKRVDDGRESSRCRVARCQKRSSGEKGPVSVVKMFLDFAKWQRRQGIALKVCANLDSNGLESRKSGVCRPGIYFHGRRLVDIG